MIFTGGKSAIDLWTWNGDEFDVIELKTKNVGLLERVEQTVSWRVFQWICNMVAVWVNW